MVYVLSNGPPLPHPHPTLPGTNFSKISFKIHFFVGVVILFRPKCVKMSDMHLYYYYYGTCTTMQNLTNFHIFRRVAAKCWPKNVSFRRMENLLVYTWKVSGHNAVKALHKIIFSQILTNEWRNGVNNVEMGFIPINSMGPSDTIWWHRCGSTLVQVMACCLMAPSHYKNKCWLIISETCWYLAEYNFTKTVLDITHYKMVENYIQCGAVITESIFSQIFTRGTP